MATDKEIEDILTASKALARKYRALTGKPLGITGEVAEFSASKILGLSLEGARQSGYEAIRKSDRAKIQIKGRSFPQNAISGQTVGIIKLHQPWDVVLLVILDEDMEVKGMFEADRLAIEQALKKPGSKARDRGVLPVSWFKKNGRSVYNS